MDKLELGTTWGETENERIPLGIPGLDSVFGGGLARGRSILLEGPPGSGKTILGLKIVMNGILQFQEPGIVVSMDLFPEQFREDARCMGWDFAALEAEGNLAVLFIRRDDLYSPFTQVESTAVSRITDSAIALGARRVFVDSGSQFWRLPLSEQEQRRVFLEFTLKLKALGLTPVLTSEWIGTQGGDYAREEFAADIVVRLHHESPRFPASSRPRFLEIVKARGTQVKEGKHYWRIDSGGGTEVFPCIELATGAENTLLSESTARAPFGVPQLDALLGGGVAPGTLTLAAGGVGTGKRALAHAFLSAGAEGGAAILISDGSAIPDGWHPLEFPGLHPMELYYRIEEQAEMPGVTRIVLLGIGSLFGASAGAGEWEYYVLLLRKLFRRTRVTAFCTLTTSRPGWTDGMPEIPCPSLWDNLIYSAIGGESGSEFSRDSGPCGHNCEDAGSPQRNLALSTPQRALRSLTLVHTRNSAGEGRTVSW